MTFCPSSGGWSVCVNKKISRSVPGDGPGARVAAMFGLPDGYDETLYSDFVLDMKLGQITVVVGPSGAGKSVLLEEVAQAVDGAIRIGRLDDSFAGKAAVETLEGGTLKGQLEILSRCGLAEATTMVTAIRELSDGQRYRLGLARALHVAVRCGAPRLVIADEFCATLDISTAAVLCRQVRKLVSGSSLAVLLATSRVELLRALRPDVVIVKPMGEPARVRKRHVHRRRRNGVKRASPLPDPRKWRIVSGRLGDYKKLSRYHYLTGPPAAHKRVYVIRTPQRLRRDGAPELAAVMVISPPVISVRGRNVATFRRYVDRDRCAALGRLNREVECISRVIVHPSYRGCGLAVRLVKHAINTSPMPIVEALAAMGKIHPFFRRAGMRLVGLFKGPTQYYQYYISIRPDQG